MVFFPLHLFSPSFKGMAVSSPWQIGTYDKASVLDSMGNLPNNATWMNVELLYTNVPYKYGLQAIKTTITWCQDGTPCHQWLPTCVNTTTLLAITHTCKSVEQAWVYTWLHNISISSWLLLEWYFPSLFFLKPLFSWDLFMAFLSSWKKWLIKCCQDINYLQSNFLQKKPLMRYLPLSSERKSSTFFPLLPRVYSLQSSIFYLVNYSPSLYR